MSAELTAVLERTFQDRSEWKGKLSPELVELAHQIDDADHGDVRDSRICLPPRPDETSTRESHIRGLRTSRKCTSPRGLVDDDGGVTIAPCRECTECRLWDARLDAVAVTEAIPDPVYSYVPEDKYQATVKRLKRHGLEYSARPVKAGWRLLVTEAGYDGPVVGPPDVGVLELFVEAEGERDREQDRRQASSSSGIRARTAMEAEVYDQPEGQREEKPRKIIGWFPPRLVTRSHVVAKQNSELERLAIAAQVPYDLEGTTVRLRVGRHDPRAEWFYDRIAVKWYDSVIPWYEGGPPPAPGDKDWESWEKAEAKVWTPFTDEPPEWVYDRESSAVYEEHWAA